jgi:DNA-binding transcriptional LysR family regulator
MNLFVSYKYLVALDDHRHFGRAALACHVTQPALSNALRALEEHFGTSIVQRGRSFAGFTTEGEQVLASARRMLHEQELLQQDLHSSSDSPKGLLRMGVVPTAMPVAARFVALLRDKFPGIRPTLRSMSSVELEMGLDQLALDLGLGYTERSDDSRVALQTLPQYVERYYLLRKATTGAVTAAKSQATITWAEAAVLPLCLLSPEMHNRTIIDRAFASAGAVVQPVIETNSTVTLVLSVLAGRESTNTASGVCSVLPGALLATTQGQAGLQALALVGPTVEVPIALTWHASNRPSRTLAAALRFAQDPAWTAQVAQHAGLLGR